MYRLSFLVITTAILVSSCNNTPENKMSSTSTIKDTVSHNTLQKEEVKKPFEYLTSKEIPYTDSTNFNNYEYSKKNNTEPLLQQISKKLNKKDLVNLAIRYQLPLSSNFSSIVVTYNVGDHELFTTLINIDKSGTIIDHLDIAYDEIAESAFSSSSVINTNVIETTNWNYMEEIPSSEKETFSISTEGKFIKK